MPRLLTSQVLASSHLLPSVLAAGLAALVAPAAAAQDAEAAGYFGFDGLEVVKIDPNAGPVASGDFDGDGKSPTTRWSRRVR